MSPGAECASIRAATTAGGGGGANRSNAGRLNPGSARRRSAARPSASPMVAAPATRPVAFERPGRCAPRRAVRRMCARDTRRVSDARRGLVGLLDERLVGRLLRRQDAVEVLDLLVLDVVLEIVLEILVLADERALGVGRRSVDLAAVGNETLP